MQMKAFLTSLILQVAALLVFALLAGLYGMSQVGVSGPVYFLRGILNIAMLWGSLGAPVILLSSIFHAGVFEK